jgi:hypothetical protein
MEAVAWTAIGLLGTTQALLVAALFHLSSRIEGQGQRIDAQGGSLREAIEGQGQRIDAQGGSLREAIEVQGRELRAAIDAQTARIDALNSRMDAHLERHTA